MIRRAKIEDIPPINELLQQVLAVHNAGRPDIFKPHGQKYTDDELAKILIDDYNPVFVYEDDAGTVLGHCFTQTNDRTESASVNAYKTLYIDDLCVHEDARGRHVGKALYDYVRNYAKQNGYHNVTLHAWECNPKAVGFYEHLGLKVQSYTFEEIL